MMTDKVLAYIEKLSWVELPPEVRHQAKRCLLDGLGALIAGMTTPVGRLMNDFAADCFQGVTSHILVDGRRVSAVGAALAHGFAANALDIDDGYRLVKGHPGACILPVLLTAAELTENASCTDFLTALVAGYEVGIRAGLILHASYPTYHGSGSWGVFGGVAAAGKVLGLHRETLRQAFGATEYHAPITPMMKCIDAPAMTKDGIGWSALVAMASVQMAQRGFTGIRPLFDEPCGTQSIESLGSRHEIMNLYFKPYAACRWAQPAVAGALQVVDEHRLEPARITRVRVRSFAAALALRSEAPRNTEEAQYNISFPLAAALVDRAVGPRQVLPPRLHDEQILALAQKVELESDAEFDAVFPAKTRAEVIIETSDGKEFRSGVVEPRWEPPDGLPSDAELTDKFKTLVGPVLGMSRTEGLIAMIFDMDEHSRIQGLLAACRSKNPLG